MTTNTQLGTATNFSGVNVNNSVLSSNNADQYFTNFYSIPLTVSAGQNDAITAFFQQYSPNPQAAQALASAVLYTALAENLNPLVVLSQFEAMPKGQLTVALAAFLNVTRVQTSMLGINHGVTTSPFVARTILV
jgi:hypothetical protein